MSDKTVLYISYNGIRESLVQSQVLNYLTGLGSYGYRFVLLTFEREGLAENEAEKIFSDLAAKRIAWKWMLAFNFFKPFSTYLDVLRGAGVASKLCNEYDVNLIHTRSLVPALIAGKVKKRLNIPYLYDIRGFWVDEKVYKGSLHRGSLFYLWAKSLETSAYKKSDAIVSLTDAAIAEIKKFSCWQGMKMPPMLTIPTCVAVDRFFRSTEKREGPVVFGYVGSLGRGYLAKELFTFFTIAGKHFPGSKLLIITKTDHAWLAEFASSKGVDLSRVEIKEVHHDQVPQEVWRMDVGLSFIEPHYSKTASCPTKLGEYLAAGVPIVANRGVGDVDALIEENRIGIVLDEFSLENIEQSLQNLKLVVRSQEVADRCVATAKKHFSLDIGIQRYHATYKEILNKVII